VEQGTLEEVEGLVNQLMGAMSEEPAVKVCDMIGVTCGTLGHSFMCLL
jgi:hypothetical protein